MRIGLLAVVLSLAGCSRSAESEGRGANEPKSEVSTGAVRKAEVTPALARKAEEILQAHEAAAIGTEIPFSLDGQQYIARIEEHDNPDADPTRPPGKHKGVTVYLPQ